MHRRISVLSSRIRATCIIRAISSLQINTLCLNLLCLNLLCLNATPARLIALGLGLLVGVGLEADSATLVEDLLDLARTLCLFEVVDDPVIIVA